MAHKDTVSMDATLRALVSQQEEILKCVQSWQTGQRSFIGEYLGRLDEKVDLLLASGRGGAHGEARSSTKCRVAGTPKDASTPSNHLDGPVEEGMRMTRSFSDFATNGALPGKASLQEASTGSEIFGCSRSVNLPHTVSDLTDEAASGPVIKATRTTRSRWDCTLPNPKLRSKSLRKYIISKRQRSLMAKQPWFVRVTKSTYFEVLCSALIILNVMIICWQTQVTASSVEDAFASGAAYIDSEPALFVAVQAFFTAFFVSEVLMRWAATGPTRFLSNDDRVWNWFDILIVSAGLLQQISQFFEKDVGLRSIFLVRCLRILRLLRVLRTLRYFMLFRELRMLINTCTGGLKSYIWFCCINFLIVLFFGITLTTRTYTYIMTSEQYADDEGARLLQGFFGTLDKSMLSLFQAVNGGRDWYELYDLLRMVGVGDCLLFLFFLSFSIYVLANAAAAVFVECAMTHAAHDTELVIKQHLERDCESRKKLLNVFEEMDYDCNGTLTLEEFTSHLEDDRVVAYFDAFQLDAAYATQIFNLLDADGSGQVNIHEFIDGCIKLRGEARQLKLYEIQHAISSINKNLRKINRLIESRPSATEISMQGGHQASSAGRAWLPPRESEGA